MTPRRRLRLLLHAPKEEQKMVLKKWNRVVAALLSLVLVLALLPLPAYAATNMSKSKQDKYKGSDFT